MRVVAACALVLGAAVAAAEDAALQSAAQPAAESASAPTAGAAVVDDSAVLTAGAPLALVWDGGRGRGALAAGDELLILQPSQDADGHPDGALHVLTRLASVGLAHLALGPDDGTVYGSNPDSGELSSVALADGRLLAHFPAGGPAPAALFYQPVLHRLVSFNAGASTVTAFDVASRAFEGLIPLGDAPVAVTMAPDGRMLALLPVRRELVLIGVHPLRIAVRWPLPAACPEPADLAVDPGAARIFIACGVAEVAVFDLHTGDWAAPWHAGGAASRLHQILRDGVSGQLLAVARNGAVAIGVPDAATTTQVQLPAGSLVALDAHAHRLIWAVAAPAGQIRLGSTLLPPAPAQRPAANADH